MSNLTTLREHLFETLQALRDKENPMDLDRAKTISDVAQTLINSAKVEVDFMKQTGAMTDCGFISETNVPALPGSGSTRTANGTKSTATVPGGSVTTHKMR